MKKAMQVIALGGGGFSMEPDNPALDLYLLAQTGHSNPRVCFLATASGDSDAYIMRFYAAFSRYRCRPAHLPLFNRTPELRPFLLGQDLIYVGGGNTKSLLGVWREWGLDGVLEEAYRSGIVLAGISAGAICWFEQGITDSLGGRLSALTCLGFLPESCCPHYDGEADRRPSFHRMLAAGEIGPGYAVDDGAALHFIDGALHKVITSRPGARAYRVEIRSGVVEQPLAHTYLGRSGES